MKKHNTYLIYPLVIMGFFLFFTNGCSKSSKKIDGPQTSGSTVLDKDGNVYHMDTIGHQIWLVENLKTTRYNDNSIIKWVPDPTEWSTLGIQAAGCWFNNDIGNRDTYGALYDWYAVSSGKLCPVGWHVPTDAEWQTMIDYVGSQTVAGGFLKETLTTHWATPNTGATNHFGFTALPGGVRYTTGTFYFQKNAGYWWSSTESSSTSAWHRVMYYNLVTVDRITNSKDLALSVRCIKDNLLP